MTTPHAISTYFFHSGKGQSIAVRFEPNNWIVVDADEIGTRKRRRIPALDLLRQHEKEEDFKLDAVILSHFHSDHYRGLPPLIQHFEDLGKLGMVLLPTTWQYFHPYLAGEAKRTRNARLEQLMELVGKIRDKNRVGTINAFEFVRPVHGGGIKDDEPWLFCLHPRQQDIIDALGKKGFLTRPGRAAENSPPNRWLRTKANDYAYMLSLGYGRHVRDLHLLLTTDISGRSFSRLTRELRSKWIPMLSQDLPGAPANLNQLLITDPENPPEGRRTRPIQGMSVPHHGSALDAVPKLVLEWWLGGPSANRGSPPVAVVQGDEHAFRLESFEPLKAAKFRIFSSSRPLRLVEEDVTDPELKRRLPQLSRNVLRSPAFYKRENGKLENELGYLALHGGAGGLHRIEARNFYEVLPSGEAKWHETLDERLAGP